MNKLRLKYWITSIATVLLFCFAAVVAMVHAFVPDMFLLPGQSVTGSMLLFSMFKAIVVIIIAMPAIWILSHYANMYQGQIWAKKKEERKKKEGPKRNAVMYFSGTVAIDGDVEDLDIDTLKDYLESAVTIDIDVEGQGNMSDNISVSGISLDWETLEEV